MTNDAFGDTTPSGVITILMTDIEGSTARWERRKKEMKSAVQRHDAVIVQCVEAHGGRDLFKKGEGDSHVAIFNSPHAAASAACAIHRALASQDWGEVETIRVRIALHSGEPEFRNNDIFGPEVNRCARMRAAAHGGQTIVSDATKRLLASALPDGCTVKDLGSHRFKDLLEPGRIYQLCSDGLKTDFPKLNSLTGPNNLPIQLTSFIGRTTELEKIAQMQSKHRLVTLDGTGGGGKTRLAIQVGAEALDRFPDGVWFVTFVGIAGPDLVAERVAEGLPISTKDGEALTSIRTQLADAEALLVIDNCEEAREAAAKLVEALLRDCPRISILATSREKLGVRGEGVYRVPPLNFDLKGQPATEANIGELEAVKLLRDRAASVLSGEEILTEVSAPILAKICKKLDGIPLAIEQAAANLAYMSPWELLERLDEQCNLPGQDQVGLPDRHRTMVAALEVSYQGLSDSERLLFARLSIFPSGWSIKCAEHVCADASLTASDILPLFGRLVNRSLAISERSEALQSIRFRMLEPVRQFAGTKLESGDREDLCKKLVDWCLQICQQAYLATGKPGGNSNMRLLEAEHDNILASLTWCLSRPNPGPEALELCVYTHRYWLKRGFYSEGASWLQRAITASGISDDKRAEALNILGIFSWHTGDLAPAETAFRESLNLWERIGDQNKQAMVLNNLSGLAFMREDYERVAELLHAASEVFREHGDLERLATALENLGVATSMLNDLDVAERHLQEAILLHRRHGNSQKLAKALDSLLGIYVMRGTLPAHFDLLLEALDIGLVQEIPNPFQDSNLLEVSASACLERGQLELAAKACGAMDRLVEENGLALPPNQVVGRETLKQKIKETMGYQKYQSSYRKGWVEGSESVLRQILEFVSEGHS